MAKQAIYGNYVVTVEDNGSVNVTKSGALCDNTNAALKEIAEQIGFAVDPKWNCRQLGPKILKEISGGKPASAPAAVPVAAAPKAQQAVTEQKVGSSKELEAALARIAELEAENKKLKAELEKANKANKDDKSAKKSNDPFEGLMVRVCAGMFEQKCTCWKIDREAGLYHPGGDKRKTPVWQDSTGYVGDMQKRRVTITKEFQIAKYPVTQGQWKAIMGEGFNPSQFKGNDNHPVENVSWDDVQEFIKKLNQVTGKKYRLPTEAEWQWACMGAGKDSDFGQYAGCSRKEDLVEYAWFSENAEGKTHPVGEKKPNELGLYDMNGNVYEYCSDLSTNQHGYGYRDWSSSDAIDPKGSESGGYRVMRGGGYGSKSEFLAQYRTLVCPWVRKEWYGFRLAQTLD